MFLSYLSSGDIVEVIIKDSSGRKIDTRKCNGDDKVEYGKLLKYLLDKYGFSPEITFPEQVNQMKKKDIDWLDTNIGF